MSNGTTRGESPAAVRMAAAPRSGPGRSARTGINPTTGRSYIIAHVLRVLLIKPLMAAGHERPSAVSFLRGLTARSVFLLAATVGLHLLDEPLGGYCSRLFQPIQLSARLADLYPDD